MSSVSPSDPRMRGFARRSTVDDAFHWIQNNAQLRDSELISILQCCGRTLAQEVTSRVNVPGFRRAMMDGYAIRAVDSEGASTLNRLPVQVIGEVLPGQTSDLVIGVGEAVRIMTGAAVPAGCDAVVPVERTESDRDDKVFLVDPLTPGKNVARVGEDIAENNVVLSTGRALRPQDVGVLSSIGVSEVQVVRRPRVRIVVTGNELLPPGSVPRDFQIVDANSPMLAGLIERDGGIALNPGIIPDNVESITEALHDDVDVVLVSGGSSVGKEDFAPSLLARDGNLAIHGIAMRPSSPAGMGTLGNRLVFLLPGNPVSCLCAYDFFAGRAIRMLGGRATNWPYRSVHLPLRRKLVSTVGRVDYARVQLIDGAVEPIAISGASMLSSTTRADGFVVIAGDSEGYPEDKVVEVFLY
ncbi:MAG: molybdopterin molybdotransferase [Pirellulaceae bacterium]|jgi:molybdopterin molybdotransferase